MSFNQGDTAVVNATFDTVPDATPTVLARKADGTTDATITFGTVTGSNGNRTYSSLMTIDGATTVGHKNVVFTATITGTVNERFGYFRVDTQQLSDLAGIGTGNYEVTINVKAGGNNIEGVQVTIHNSNDDDTPIYGPLTTGVDGNAGLFMLDGNFTVRGSKSGFLMTPQAITVTGTGTKNVTGTIQTITPPSDPDLCRLVLFVTKLNKEDAKNLKIEAWTKEKLSKTDGIFITNKIKRQKFTYDSGTTPDSYYYDAIQGEKIIINSPELGIDEKEIDVPAQATKDLADLIDE
jgi:hypothetical protein